MRADRTQGRLPRWARLYLWACHRLYDQLAWAYDAVSWLVSFGAWSAWRRLALDYVGPGETLEIGFGTGELLAEMAARGLRVTGVEPSAAMQRVTAGKLRRRGLAVRRVYAQAQALPFPSGSFAAVAATFPAEYIGERETLREVARVLRPAQAGKAGGRLVIVGWVAVNHPVLRQVLLLFYGALARRLCALARRAGRGGPVAEGRGARLRLGHAAGAGGGEAGSRLGVVAPRTISGWVGSGLWSAEALLLLARSGWAAAGYGVQKLCFCRRPAGSGWAAGYGVQKLCFCRGAFAPS